MKITSIITIYTGFESAFNINNNIWVFMSVGLFEKAESRRSEGQTNFKTKERNSLSLVEV